MKKKKKKIKAKSKAKKSVKKKKKSVKKSKPRKKVSVKKPKRKKTVKTAKKKAGVKKQSSSSKISSTRKKFLKKIIAELEEDKRMFQKRIDEAKRDAWTGTVNDEHDEAQASVERDIMFEQVDSYVRRLEDVETALKKIKTAKFGVCEICGKQISMNRLKLIPYARYCSKCAEKGET